MPAVVIKPNSTPVITNTGRALPRTVTPQGIKIVSPRRNLNSGNDSGNEQQTPRTGALEPRISKMEPIPRYVRRDDENLNLSPRHISQKPMNKRTENDDLM